jgi:hypothetical protein
MDDLVLTAKKLRAVRKASRHFLTLWALEQMAARERGEAVAVEAASFIRDPGESDWRVQDADFTDDS